MTAKTSKSRKAKGREFQQDIRDDLIAHLGIEEGDVVSTGMGQPGCDLYLSPAAREQFPFGVECKRREKISLPEWWAQCTANAEEEGLTPLLIFRRSRKDAMVVMRWSDFLKVVKEAGRA